MSFLLDLFDNKPEHGWTGLGFFGTSTAGETVTESTSMTVSAFFACLRVLAEDVSQLPLHLHRKEGNNRLTIEQGPVADLLGRLLHVRETLTAHAASWGNGYAEIIRDADGIPLGLAPIHPGMVEVRIMGGELIYDVTKRDGSRVTLFADDMFHLHGLGGDGKCGYSVIRIAAESLGLTIAANKFGAAFFGNGASPGIGLEHPEKLSREAKQNLRESWEATHRGAGNAKRPFVLDEGMKISTYSVPPEEAQFLETRQFQIEEVCRWFRMMPTKIGHNTSTPYTNVEALGRAHVSDTLMPWLVRWETEIKDKLLTVRDRTRRVYAKHNVRAMMRGDTAARAAYYRTMTGIGAYSPNDVRRLEDENPIDGGDVHMVQINMTTLQNIADGRNLREGGATSAQSQQAADEQSASAKTMASKTMAAVFLASADRCMAKEMRARQQARAKYDQNPKGLHSWSQKFYAGYRSDLVEAFRPAVDAWAGLCDADTEACMQAVESWADAYCAHAQVCPSSEIAATPTTMADDVQRLIAEVP